MTWWALWTFRLVLSLGIGTLVVVLTDAVLRGREAWRRRRRSQGGVYGVVVDRNGFTLGTYVDPLTPPRRATYVHGPGSAWTSSDPDDPTAWAWEGQGETEEEARHLAQRLRLMYLKVLPELRPASEDEVSLPPWA